MSLRVWGTEDVFHYLIILAVFRGCVPTLPGTAISQQCITSSFSLLYMNYNKTVVVTLPGFAWLFLNLYQVNMNCRKCCLFSLCTGTILFSGILKKLGQNFSSSLIRTETLNIYVTLHIKIYICKPRIPEYIYDFWHCFFQNPNFPHWFFFNLFSILSLKNNFGKFYHKALRYLSKMTDRQYQVKDQVSLMFARTEYVC